MSAIRYWEIYCDAEWINASGKQEQCGASVDTMDWYLAKVRKQAKRDGWTRGPNGEDYCRKHAEQAR